MGRFHFVGPLPADSKLFVGRKKELKTARELCLGPLQSYITVVGARQMGKTSFLYRLQRELAPHLASVLINLQVIPDATPSALFRFMATEIAKQLDLPALLCNAERVSSGPEFAQFLNELPARIGRVVILIDEISSLPEKTAIYLANVLRAVFNDRLLSGFEALGRFIFLLSGGSELLNLSMTMVSPFSNIATSIYLPDLTLGEVKQLIACGLSGTPLKIGMVQELAEAIYEQTHGHPYLTQRMAAHIADYAQLEDSLPEPSWVSKARLEMLSNDENIRHIHKALQDPALLDAAFQTIQQPTPFRHLSLRHEKLFLLGIIRTENGIALPHNSLYAHAVHQLAE
ncbi:MAG: AAA-like domain-containing protein, partial [Chloroflexi bacterium]|nr:AAA-like domain-containing protein [Chloroflexota bacterium]